MQDKIIIKGARVHNLKNVDLELPRHQLIVFTGLSGSGKSSLAFDTIFAEGQRRYMESLSAYARQFLDKMDKPDVDSIEGLSPAISIDQKNASKNPRSTVGTVTEIYDYFRLLFASIGVPHCPQCGKEVQGQSPQEITDYVMGWPANHSIQILAPLIQNRKGEYKDIVDEVKQDGFSRLRINGSIYRVTDDIPKLDKQKKHTIEIVVDRLSISPNAKTRLFESIETALRHGKGLVVIEDLDAQRSEVLSEHLACPDCHVSLPEISPRLFSFNSPVGACPDCNGLGDKMDFDPELVIPDKSAPVRLCTGKALNLDDTYYGRSAEKTIKKYGFSMDTPVDQLSDKQYNILVYGSEKAIDYNPFLKNPTEERPKIFGDWEGILTNLRRRYFQTQSEGMRFYFRSFMSPKPCETCQGARLRPIALGVQIQKKTINDITDMSVDHALLFFAKLQLSAKEQEIARQILKEINERLHFLKNVGLQYLTLSRRAGTLSGGEYQRIRLATQIGAGLTGVLYVLDEPSIGLHQRDNQRLIDTLIRLRDLGNTLVVVEHDEDTMLMADYIVDIGPAAGRDGGKIIFAGTPKALLKSKNSLTADYLSGRKKIAIPKTRRQFKKQDYLIIKGATENNLKNITVRFPLKKFICVTGVSGSGKSTLINDILDKALMRHFYKSKDRVGVHRAIEGLSHLDKLITIDQSPIGRTPRSNPATYTGLFTPLRELFAQTREAKIKGYKAGRFSFNVKGGRCEACEGDGVVKIEMHFLSDVYVTCEVCKGKRYNEQTLQVTYKGYTISDVLNMTVTQAVDVFEHVPIIRKKLETLQDVGLGYVALGQSATTLSGGEAQRIKLSKELSKVSTGRTLYLLDEPTTGLHFTDIERLLSVLNRLTDAGNTVIVIEHNLDVIKTADHIIDLGPEGGEGGGQVIAEGSPEDLIKNKQSITGEFLKKYLKK